ncbi:HicB family protein [Bacillus phage Pony]|uniref:HicB family protein n=1 Tax=Bacillus phage Pony TaxID=1406789 RepID=U5Q029_9CAUD|nr:HicB family protein [Bacillus phage Pony]AGY48277.1 HicB family protein [Bacillus phage Pony]
MTKRFNVFLDENTHKNIKVTAFMKGESMNDYIVKAIMAQLKKDGALKK